MTATRQNITSETLAAVRGLITADDPLLAGRLRTASPGVLSNGFSELFDATGAGEVAGEAQFRLAIEFIFEGYLLHYGVSRLFKPGTAELDLLAGDYMYARGLVSISRLGDLDCIRMLADLISICSLVHCEGLSAGQAFETWCVTTLCLARHAGAAESLFAHTGSADSSVAAVAALKNSFWKNGRPPEGYLEKIIAAWPAETGARLRVVISDIYSSLEGHLSAPMKSDDNGKPTTAQQK